MNANFMIIECQQGHRFRHGLMDDGYRNCPRCDSLLDQPYYAPKEKAQQLVRISQAWRDKQRNDKGKSLSITIEADTDKLQQKLRAISKHTEALADELDAIDNQWQCDCGSFEYSDHNFTSTFAKRVCGRCKESYRIAADSPTHLEGNE